jgi:Mechanosensitive ion channel, beta-domain/Mechanosensitive ion channel MscS, C-terminal
VLAIQHNRLADWKHDLWLQHGVPRTFKVGDRVKIGDHVGDVEEVRLMVTYLRAPKNEIVVVPNSQIIAGAVANYSALARTDGLIPHTAVGIGYETPWRQVDAMLLLAAANTAGLLRQPSPFVLQKELGDLAIVYELNAFCAEARAMIQLHPRMHANILDVFNEYGIQIMTPAYEGDPEAPKVVPKELWHVAPAQPTAFWCEGAQGYGTTLGEGMEGVAIAINDVPSLLHFSLEGGIVRCELTNTIGSFNQKQTVAFVSVQPTDGFLWQNHTK